MKQGTAVSYEGCTYTFSADTYRKYKAALETAEAEVIERFGQRPGFGSPDAVASWEYEVTKTTHSRLFGDKRTVYNGARLPEDTSDSWAIVEAFRQGEHSPIEDDTPCCQHCGRVVEYGSCRWTDCPGNAGVEDTNYL